MSDAASPPPAPLRTNRDYVWLMSGQTVSVFGSAMTGLALLLIAVTVTHSASRAGFVSAAFGAGQFVGMLPAGALVDRWDRKAVMVWSSIAGAIVMGSVPLAALLGHLTFVQLLFVGLLEGLIATFYSPAERGALKQIVPPSQMGTASSVNQARSAIGQLGGPPVAGLLFAVSRTLPLLVDAVSYLVAAVSAVFVRADLKPPPAEAKRNIWHEMAEGLKWVWQARAIRDLVAVGLVFNLAANGLVTMNLLDLRLRGVSARDLGIMSAAYGASGLVAALIAPQLLKRWAVGPLGLVCLLGMVASLSALPVVPGVVGSAVLIGLAFALLTWGNVGWGAYMMHITPQRMQGRAASAANFVSVAMIPIGVSLGGVLVQHIGRPGMWVFVAILVVGAVIGVTSHALRTIPKTVDFDAVPVLD